MSRVEATSALRRVWLLAVLGMVSTVVVALYAWATAPAPPPARTTALPVIAPGSVTVAPSLLVRHTALDGSHGFLAAEYPAGSSMSRHATSLQCEAAYFAGGRGVCLEAHRRAFTTFTAVLFDASFQPTARIPLAGSPSRARVSPDGRYAATTVFLFGHSYSSASFSTETRIVDAATGTAVIGNLEQLQVWSNGSPLKAPDFNFWGVTFAANSSHFYATLGTKGRTYLVQGDIGSGRVTTVKEGIECPSLSPDNTRVAFKKRVDGSGSPKWRLYVLDLASLVESPVAETRFIDEQVEWLDNGHILYAQTDPLGKSPVVSDVWMVAADGSGQPSLFLANASTPIVLRR
jgi:hypothetical protein